MPVEDHEVYVHGKRAEGHRAGCYNRTGFNPGFWAQDGWEEDSGSLMAHPHWVWVPYIMSTKCRQINDLPECEGCTAEKDVEYITKMKAL